MTPSIHVTAGDRILCDTGVVLVLKRVSDGVRVRDHTGEVLTLAYKDLITTTNWAGEVQVASRALPPQWFGLDRAVQEVAWNRLEVVQLVCTGYCEGLRQLARPGEPSWPFDPASPVSDNIKYEEAARLLTEEYRADRHRARRFFYGETGEPNVSKTSIRRWVKSFQKDGLFGLVDKRALRGNRAANLVDPRFCAAIDEILAQFTGDPSVVEDQEIIRSAKVALKRAGETDLNLPRNAVAAFVSARTNALGSTTRAHLTRHLGKVATNKHILVSRPGQTVGIDATRVDNLIWDPILGGSRSIEVLTAYDVGSRAVFAQRFVPLNANALELGLLVYDMARTFTLEVDGTNVGRWKWTGFPGAIDLSEVTVEFGGPMVKKPRIIGPEPSPLDGLHRIPAADAVVASLDRGSINVAAEFRSVAAHLGIHLMFNRGGKATDNAHIERFHETLQRAFQQIPGYKGRCVGERGRIVAKEALLTLEELEGHMQKWICLDYHRSEHTGIIMPGAPRGRFTPMEAFDILSEPYGPVAAREYRDQIFQFLPVRWLTIGHAGVEADSHFQYDDRELFESIDDVAAKGRYRDKDGAAPFYYDRNDITRLWYQHPDTGEIHEIPWKGRDFVDLPMTDRVGEIAYKQIRDRGGNSKVTAVTGRDQIFEQLTELTPSKKNRKWFKEAARAEIRWQRSRTDLGETAAVMNGKRHEHQHPLPPTGTDPQPVPAPGMVTTTDAVTDLKPWEQPWHNYTI